MERISGEIKQRELFIAETERRISKAKQQLENARAQDVRWNSVMSRPEQRKEADKQIAVIHRDIAKREQSRECTSIKERLEAKKELLPDEKEKLRREHTMIGEFQDKLCGL